MMSGSILDSVSNVKYEDRIGADFDHKEVFLLTGRDFKSNKTTVYDTTLADTGSDALCTWAVYDAINNHLVNRDEILIGHLNQLNILIKERETINTLIERVGLTDDLKERGSTADINIGVVLRRLPRMEDLMARELGCDHRRLYEMIMMGLKDTLMGLQKRKKVRDSEKREWLLSKVRDLEYMFGENSDQAESAREAVLRYDDIKLKERASKFSDFLGANNEKATKAFCRLSKEGGVCDDVAQIKDDNGNAFTTDKDRENHIKGFYESLYKRKMDGIMEIEDFLENDVVNLDWVSAKKLNEDEKASLDGPITMQEVEDALNDSNFESTSGWDGISYKVIRKCWPILKIPMLGMIHETFECGELMQTFKLGLIKIIPKKGNPMRIGDWRPITLLCCGYKLISGLVAERLEKYLMKIIGRAQKGFMKQKNIHMCAANIITCISQSG
jgi:hypothetical protein